METISQILPIIIYLLLIALIVIGIIIGLKVIITMNKIERIVENVENKVNSLNGIFNAIEKVSNKVTGVYETIVNFLSGLIDKIFIGKRKESEDNEDE